MSKFGLGGRSNPAVREGWVKIVHQQLLMKGTAPSSELAEACGEKNNDHFYSWLRTQKLFVRTGKVIGKSGQVNIQWRLPPPPAVSKVR